MAYSFYSKDKNFAQGQIPSLLVKKLIFFSSEYIKPVKVACNSIML